MRLITLIYPCGTKLEQKLEQKLSLLKINQVSILTKLTYDQVDFNFFDQVDGGPSLPFLDQVVYSQKHTHTEKLFFLIYYDVVFWIFFPFSGNSSLR